MTIYIGAYNSGLQLITSWTRIIDGSVDKTKVKTVDSGVMEHLLEQVNKLQTDLEEVFGELIPIRHEGKPLPEAIKLETRVNSSYVKTIACRDGDEKCTETRLT